MSRKSRSSPNRPSRNQGCQAVAGVVALFALLHYFSNSVVDAADVVVVVAAAVVVAAVAVFVVAPSSCHHYRLARQCPHSPVNSVAINSDCWAIENSCSAANSSTHYSVARS